MNTLAAHQDFLLRRASQDEMYMAYSLATYITKNSLNMNEVQAELECDNESFLKLALCRRLAFGDPNFQQGIQQIADYTSIDVTKLASLLKRIAMLPTFSQTHKNSFLAPISFVAAAREKDASTDGPQPSGDK